MRKLTSVQKRRITKLRDFFVKLPGKHFNLATYRNPDTRLVPPLWSERGDLEAKLQASLAAIAKGEEMLPNCGTTACIAGWFPAVFPRAFEWKRGYDVVLKGQNYSTVVAYITAPYIGIDSGYFYSGCWPQKDPAISDVVRALTALIDSVFDPDVTPDKQWHLLSQPEQIDQIS